MPKQNYCQITAAVLSTEQIPKRSLPMTRDELDALPLTVDLRTAARALGVSLSTAYAHGQRGTFPVEPIKVGNRYTFPTQKIRKLLCVDECAA